MKISELWSKSRTAVGKIGRKTIIAIAAVAVIAVAVVLNIVLYSNDSGDVVSGGDGTAVLTPAIDVVEAAEGVAADGTGEGNYFAEMALSRQQARDEAMEVLKSVAENAQAVDEMKAEALDDIAQIALDIEREANIETLILSKGFAQCVAVVNGDSASVIVATDGLLEGEIAQISEIVYEEAGIVPASLKIIEKSTQ